jgi:carbamate kinase
MRAIQATTIRHLMDRGVIVVAGGGGGIPVFIDGDGDYEGFDAVIDKDLASAVIGNNIDAEVLAILTSVNGVAINYGTEDEKMLGQVTLSEIKKYYEEGHFPPGSMGPKIEAAIRFLENGGRMVTISSLEQGREAIHGNAGTRIIAE